MLPFFQITKFVKCYTTGIILLSSWVFLKINFFLVEGCMRGTECFFFHLVLAQKALKMFQFIHKVYTTVALDKPRCLKDEWLS